MPETLIVLGTSARALAFSAHRGGFSPMCGDLFADSDLRRAFSVTRVDDYPAGLLTVAEASPPVAWMYCGALENDPALIDRIAAVRPLLGHPGHVVCQLRDPVQVAAALARAGLSHPAVAVDSRALPRDSTWLVKHLRGSGGRHVRAWDADAKTHSASQNDFYFQQRIEGVPCAGIYLAAGGDCRLLGVTRQLIGQDWTRAGGWQYSGSIGPLSLAEDERDRWFRIGRCLSRSFQLSGLFGVDAVVDSRAVWPVEVNPRYTASVEILERALSISAVAWHAQACREGQLPEGVPSVPPRIHGKAILFAATSGPVRGKVVDELLAENERGDWPSVADIPSAETTVRRGHPVATVFAAGECLHDVFDRLRDQTAQLEEQMGLAGK